MLLLLLCVSGVARAAHRELVFLDTDIGDDIDDAFALTLLLQSPKVELLGVSTAFGNTQLRAQLASRLLDANGRSGIPVGTGIASPSRTTFTQRNWAEGAAQTKFVDGLDLLTKSIQAHPGKVTLIAIGPLTNIGALIDRDPETFRKLKRVVIMGGSVYKGYRGKSSTSPDAEYNIKMDAAAAQKLFNSGVPLNVMPLDSTILPLDATNAGKIYGQPAAFAAALKELAAEWTASTGNPRPILYDVMAVGSVVKPNVCPLTPMHLDVDLQGYTRPGPGTPNVNVCLQAKESRFYKLLRKRLAHSPAQSTESTR